MNRPEYNIYVPLLIIVGCPKCNGNMEPQWETRRMLPKELVEVSTICHCYNCDCDKEVIRIYQMDGRQLHAKEIMMEKKKWTIVAYPECDEGYLPRKEQIIYAINHDEAMRIAWRTFPEYHEVGAYKMD